jgi:hypothetical protein
MKFAHKYLVAKQLSPADEAAFKKQLYDVWFKVYNRTRGVRVRGSIFVIVWHAKHAWRSLNKPTIPPPFPPLPPQTLRTPAASSTCSWERSAGTRPRLSDFTTGNACTSRSASGAWLNAISYTSIASRSSIPSKPGTHTFLSLITHPRQHNSRFDYKGWIKPRGGRGGRPQDPLNTEQLLCINFEWRGIEKDASTIFVGTSPEFEIALYTMCVCVRCLLTCGV